MFLRLSRSFVFYLIGLCVFSSDSSYAADAVCARVKIEIEQELTLERQAFEARLTVTNGLPDTALTDFQVGLIFQDGERNGVPVTTNPSASGDNRFFFRMSDGSTYQLGVDGLTAAATIGAAAVGKLTWTIIPGPSAGGQVPQGQLYFVGATVTYKVNGVSETRLIEPDYIYVKPMPLLELEYFLPEQVIGDDPFTGDTFEPEVPFTLGVRVRNIGFGTAAALKIESAQPRIVENAQGLLINFQIIGSEVNGLPAQPSLIVDFGDIAAQRAGIGRWLMTTSLTGRFTDFNASFKHADDLGGQVTSLIQKVTTYDLVGDVLVDLPGRDRVKDFLARNRSGSALQIFESDRLDAVNVLNVSSGASLLADGGANAYRLALSSPVNALEMFYARVSDPTSGNLVVQRVTRADGKVLGPENAWLSKFQSIETHAWTYFLNLFDANNSGNYSYRVEFGPPVIGNRAPVLRPVGDRILRAGQTYSYRVAASDADGDPITLTTGPLPAGATFVAQGDGTGLFTWRPQSTQSGDYSIQFSASDGRLTTTRVSRLTVTGGSVFDAWKERFWPGVIDPAIVGNGADPDRDGLSNLVEYGLDLDPTYPQANPCEVSVMEVGTARFLAIAFTKRTDDPRLQFTVGGSGSLLPGANWAPQAFAVAADQTNLSDGFERVQIRDSVPLDADDSSPRRFLRMGVHLAD